MLNGTCSRISSSSSSIRRRGNARDSGIPEPPSGHIGRARSGVQIVSGDIKDITKALEMLSRLNINTENIQISYFLAKPLGVRNGTSIGNQCSFKDGSEVALCEGWKTTPLASRSWIYG